MTDTTLHDDRYTTDYRVGQDNIKMWGLDIHNPVFFTSAAIILLFVVGTVAFPQAANSWLGSAKSWSIEYFDWLFMGATNIFFLFCLALIFLPVSKIRLGGDEARPQFSTLSWFAMLFAAGMGIGLMFWCVAEPVAYFTDWAGTPLDVQPRTDNAAEMAMSATMFHWGFHAWAIYAVVALSLAFFAFNKKMPLTIRSVFYPILGERCWGWPGHIIDTAAVVATVFGLATSLGFGAQQVNAGLHFLFGVPKTAGVQIAIVVGVSGLAILSVIRGLEKGVKLLSNLNMALALCLLLFVIIAGPTMAIISGMGSNLVGYLEYLIPLSNWFGRDDQNWMHDWTVFYWAWWVSWSPFVGMFIARISKGRTIREFLVAVLLVPTAVTLIWMSGFGGTALAQSQAGIGELANGVQSASLATFQMLENLPLSNVTAVVGIALVMIFFVTSADSGSMVVDNIAAGGKVNAPVPQRVFWAVMVGLIAATLLFGGGKSALSALQAGAIATGLPFTLVLVFMCVSLSKALIHEQRLIRAHADAL